MKYCKKIIKDKVKNLKTFISNKNFWILQYIKIE